MDISRSEIINALFEKFKCKTYLEIGVRVPSDNFDKINATVKHSVDPNPMGSCTYKTTSDDFFENYIGNQNYDIIFVDGLHTEEQAYKDVINSIDHLNENGFIVMHDCNPLTEYHTRSYDEYLATRGEWNGTVFRALIKLKHELSDWSCFVINEDFGCGILTKRNILKNVQINYSDNIDWNYFSNNRNDLLQLITYNDFVKLI